MPSSAKGTAVSNTKSSGTGIWGSIAGVLALTVGLAGLGRLWPHIRENSWWLPVLISVAGTALWFTWRPLYRWLTSLPFAASLLGMLLLATVAGTVILQGVPEEMFVKKYGVQLYAAADAAEPLMSAKRGHAHGKSESLTPLPETTLETRFAKFLYSAGFTDIFHKFAYRGLLGVLALCMVLIVVKRHAWRPAEWGMLLSHAGIIVILAGGMAGVLWGQKGFIDLHEGQTAREVEILDTFGRPTGEKVPLEFGLRLDKFELEKYPIEYRMYVYRMKGEKSDVLSSTPVTDLRKWIPAGPGAKFQMHEVLPDFMMVTELLEAAPGQGAPAFQFTIFQNDGRSQQITLFAGVPDRNVVGLNRGKTLVRFVWEFDEKNSPVTREELPERHILELNGQDLAVKPEAGSKAESDKYELTVLEYLPDFAIDLQTRRRYSKSAEPNNPAMRVALRKKNPGVTEERWLYAFMPDHDEAHGTSAAGVDLHYRYEPPVAPADRDLVVVGKTREVVCYAKGVLQQRVPLEIGNEDVPLPGIDGFPTKILECATERQRVLNRSKNWRRPAVDIEVVVNGETVRTYLMSGKPAWVDDEHVIVFDKRDEVKAFRSRVSVLAPGKAPQDETIAVNHPLAHEGWWFYQSNYRKEDPTYSGISVHKDPGLATVYVGFGIICLGVIYGFYVRPRLLKRVKA